jgi:hypothetical protein
MRDETTTSFSYGPTIRQWIDQHGRIIRSAGSAAEVLYGASNCNCSKMFSSFVDPTVGHVRTQNPAILPKPMRDLVAMGLNYRPRIKSTPIEALNAAAAWVKQVCLRLTRKQGAYHTLIDEICTALKSALRVHTRPKRWESLSSGYDANMLKAQGQIASRHLACTSTDKAANTASFECLHWYRAVCMARLLSPAFVECTEKQSDTALQSIATRWAPWADLNDACDAILFATPKMHKRDADTLAYRYITNACSAYSKPVSLEVTRVLTILSGYVREHCIDLGNSLNAKLWWIIDSLDSVPFNLDRTHRPARCIAAFDVDKCYECVPLFEGEHSLLTHLSFFLNLAFGQNQYLGSKLDWLGRPKPGGSWYVYEDSADLSYSQVDVLEMVGDLLQMTVVTVGSESRQQGLGLPMGFSSSGILLNIYLFVCEYKFVLRLNRLRPDLLHHTRELFRYIDDLGCFSDYDMRVFLDPTQTQSVDNPFWIYPLAPYGPLGIKDQTERTPRSENAKAVYLDMEYTLYQGRLTMRMHFKGDNLPFKLLRFTHWSSEISLPCKLGMISAQIRTACRSASDIHRRKQNLNIIRDLFLDIGYPQFRLDTSIELAVSVYSSRFPAL